MVYKIYVTEYIDKDVNRILIFHPQESEQYLPEALNSLGSGGQWIVECAEIFIYVYTHNIHI